MGGRKHLAQQILTSWHGLSDPNGYKGDIYKLLNEVNQSKMVSRIAAALAEHDSPKAQAFIRKIDTIKAKTCYALTSHVYTAGQVSDQRSEGGMSTIKANGKLKRRLQEGTYSETVERISQVSRATNIASIEELVKCRETSKKVGTKYELALGNAKALAMKLSHVEPASEANKYIVKEHSNSSEFCLVDISAKIV